MDFIFDGVKYEFDIAKRTGAIEEKINEANKGYIEEGKILFEVNISKQKTMSVIHRVKNLKIDGVLTEVNEKFVKETECDILDEIYNCITKFDAERKKKLQK